MSKEICNEDQYGHIWEQAWIETNSPHPGFGGSIDICGYYTGQCSKCGMYTDEFAEDIDDMKICGPKIREY